MTVLDRVKTLCDERGMTLASLERKLDFGNGSLRRWENNIPSSEKILKVAQYFHVSTDYLLGNEQATIDGVQIVSRDKKQISNKDADKIQNILDAVFEGQYSVRRNLGDNK